MAHYAVKRGMARIFSFLPDRAGAPDLEFEQAKLRIVIHGVIGAYFLVAFLWDRVLQDRELLLLLTIVAAAGAGLAQLAWIARRPGTDALRRCTGIVLDVCFNTTVMALGGEITAVMYVFFPWIIIGNGFRFGRAYLHFAQVLAALGFTIVVLANPFWQKHLTLDFALLVVIAAVPWYVAVLISRLHAAGRRVEEARGDAEAANLAKTRFLAAASHDLRQPMQALSMYASVLRQRFTEPEATRIVNGVQLSVQTLERMFDSLLDIARLESGVVRPNVVAFPLMPLLARVAEAERPLAAQKRIDVRVVPTSATVRSDPVLLERMLRNLLTNAIRYTERGRIVLGCRRAGPRRVRVDVVDSGIGIPAEEQERIFEEYYQIGGARAQGLGLGLPIVRSLAELLGHPVAVRSVLGRGSAFSVELERAEGAEAPAPAEEIAPPDLAGVRVALVDDDIEIRQGIALLLESWGCRCVAGPTGGDVEAKLRRGGAAPHALIVDYRLAEPRDGVQVIEALRSAFGAALPALLITGTPNDALEARSAAGISLAVKPVPAGKLRAFLSTVQR